MHARQLNFLDESPDQEVLEEGPSEININSIVIEHEYMPSEIPLNEDGIPIEFLDLKDVFVTPVNVPPLPPHRELDLSIELDRDKPLPKKANYYPLSPTNQEIVDEYVKKALERGWIEPSNSPIAAGIFIVNQPNGKKRPCVDYRALNAITLDDAYPIPNINELLNEISHCNLFTQLDMPDAYHLVRVKEGDEWKTAFRTRSGQYQYKVISFGLKNAPPVFERFIESILSAHLRKTVLVYLDNIIIYSRSDSPEVTDEDKAKHLNDVREVILKLKDANLYLRPNKCSFAVTRIDLLGFIASWHGISANPAKLKAIHDWKPPTNIKGIQSFLGFANFYRRFIKDFSKISRPLSNLTKKSVKYQWTAETNAAFNELKKKFTSPPILSFFHPMRETILETDASDFALGSVLSQKNPSDGLFHPISFHSRGLISAECNYDTHDKELLAIVDACKFNRPMLLSLSEPFLIRSDHKNLGYFTTKQNLSQRQFRWAVFLADFHFRMEHFPGKSNIKPDALSRRTEFQKEGSQKANQKIVFNKISDNTLEFNCKELEGIIPGDFAEFPLVVTLNQLTFQLGDPEAPVVEKVNTFGGGVIKHSPQKVITFDNNISLEAKLEIFEKYHDSKTAGHPGYKKTLELIRRHHSWPGLPSDLKRYIANCVTCARAKSRRHKPYGLLQPLPVPFKPWDSISMDFITDLPKSNGFDSILVFKCRLTKQCHFIPTVKTLKTEDFVKLFIDNVYRLHGLPRDIVSDRGSLFVSIFWKGVCDQLTINGKLSTSFHPETDGSTEVVNQIVQQYLRIYGNYDQDDWAIWLPLAEFSYNNSLNSSTATTPFMAVHGFHPNVQPVPVIENASSASQAWMQDFTIRIEELRSTLKKAQENYTKFANRKRIEAPPLEIGDSVYLNGKNIKTLRIKKKLADKFYGPFKISRKINNVA